MRSGKCGCDGIPFRTLVGARAICFLDQRRKQTAINQGAKAKPNPMQREKRKSAEEAAHVCRSEMHLLFLGRQLGSC
jgi:hypothetical protein